MSVERVSESVKGFSDARLVRDRETNQYYVVSGVDAMFTGWEVLVFPAKANGEVTGWAEVAGGRGISHEEAIADLEEALSVGGGE